MLLANIEVEANVEDEQDAKELASYINELLSDSGVSAHVWLSGISED